LCDQIKTLKSNQICPYLNTVGVVGTKWRNYVNQRLMLDTIRAALTNGGYDIQILPEPTFVPLSQKLVENADEGIAYIVMPNQGDRQQIREAIESLATHLAARMGIPIPANALPNFGANK
jgi:hypothetical protein